MDAQLPVVAEIASFCLHDDTFWLILPILDASGPDMDHMYQIWTTCRTEMHLKSRIFKIFQFGKKNRPAWIISSQKNSARTPADKFLKPYPNFEKIVTAS